MFEDTFYLVPASRDTIQRWAQQDRAALNGAAAVIEKHGANPWIFAADARHFWQFASAAEIAAYRAMSPEQIAALCGWDEEDHDPASFGYSWPAGC